MGPQPLLSAAPIQAMHRASESAGNLLIPSIGGKEEVRGSKYSLPERESHHHKPAKGL